MSAGLPLLLVSILAGCVILLWILNGSGPQQKRLMYGGLLIFSVVICWILLISFGVFTEIGKYAMAGGFVISIIGLIFPAVWNRLITE